jgi:hypothetical protein
MSNTTVILDKQDLCRLELVPNGDLVINTVYLILPFLIHARKKLIHALQEPNKLFTVFGNSFTVTGFLPF